jgi:tetratricopeptide (TPR) repeat protein
MPPVCVWPARAGKDRHKMRVKTPNNFLIGSSLNLQAGFYHWLVSNVTDLHELGNRLVKAAEVAHAFRQVDRLEEIGLILSNLPIEEHRLIGQCYLGVCAYRKGGGHKGVLNEVVEKSQTYKAKALMTLAAVEASQNNFDSELAHFTKALKFADNLATFIEVSKGIAVVKAKEGYHRQALKDLEGLIPMLRYAKPNVYFDCLNSLAVELGEAGRIQEARNLSGIVVASPFAPRYPEWRETAQELSIKSYRSRLLSVPPYFEHAQAQSLPQPSAPNVVHVNFDSRRCAEESRQQPRNEQPKLPGSVHDFREYVQKSQRELEKTSRSNSHRRRISLITGLMKLILSKLDDGTLTIKMIHQLFDVLLADAIKVVGRTLSPSHIVVTIRTPGSRTRRGPRTRAEKIASIGRELFAGRPSDETLNEMLRLLRDD